MLSKLKNLYVQLLIVFSGEHSRYKVFQKYMGVKFGTNVRMTGISYFGSEPFLITIGSNVTIAKGVFFHNHDGGVGVLKHKYKNLAVIKPINVGSNVFIGSNTTIMPGVTIGDNVIIGASSVITRNIPDNVVVAGVPARIIKTLAEYEEKVLQDSFYIVNTNDEKLRKAEIISKAKPLLSHA